ncbi:hypothetical protein [Streptomyces gobiensis]|uniref:hypothetical protein n=1 Tax=Streptomyces gobiensis TaxID=2875706 RepID=UPI001E500C22|nr:hypothetical protein [Streptomyces gobiensis]UGY93858.1 hypothetical protein test1122_20495 [Streptomyces gobiensis]
MLEYIECSGTADGGFTVPWTLDRTGTGHPSWETPERSKSAVAGLQRAGAGAVRADGPSDDELRTLLSAVHGTALLDHLADADARDAGETVAGFAAPGLAQDTPLPAGAWRAARAGAALAAAAAQHAVHTRSAVYAPCRPPGHHAGPNWHGGYCFVNNAMVAVEVLARGGAGRVAVVDLDYHLGNGTLACADARTDTDYYSIHSDRGEDFPYAFPRREGLIGLPSPVDEGRYLELLAQLMDLVRGTAPDAVVVSAGFDILADDPHGSWSLRPQVWRGIGQALTDLRAPVVLVQEGGYVPRSLEESTYLLAEGMAV